MQIILTDKQYTDLRMTIISLRSSVRLEADARKEAGENFIAELHRTRLAEAEEVMESTSFPKVKRD